MNVLPLRQTEKYYAIFCFYAVDGCCCRALATAIAQIEPPAVHRAFNASCGVDEATNQGATAVWAAVLDGVNCSADIEEGNLDATEPYELTATYRKFFQLTGFEPGFGHERTVICEP